MTDGSSVELQHRVFVYGTLKRGQPNHHVINMHELGHCRLIGTARSDDSFPLIITTRWNIPFLLYAPGNGQVNTLCRYCKTCTQHITMSFQTLILLWTPAQRKRASMLYFANVFFN